MAVQAGVRKTGEGGNSPLTAMPNVPVRKFVRLVTSLLMFRAGCADLGTEKRFIAIGGGAVRAPRHGSAGNGVGHMRKGFLGSLATVALGAGLTVGQDYPPAGPGGGPPEAAFTSPDGHPIIPPPGFEGMIPPGSLPDGPGGPYPYGGGGGGGGYGSGPGIFEGGGGPPRLWYGADFLLWVPKSMPGGSTVVSTSGGADLGILGSPSARALFGDRNIGYGAWRDAGVPAVVLKKARVARTRG